VIELSDIEDPEVFALADEAREFLESQHWCERTGNGWLAFAVPGVLGVFLLMSGVTSETWTHKFGLW